MRRFDKIFSLLSYLFINFLFIYKYGIRQNYINEFILIIIYSILFFTFFYLLNRVKLKESILKIIYFSTVTLFFIFTVYINLKVDGNSLNVDRWSAMENSITALFNYQYPYTAIDHLNGRSSNLTGLLIIGIPFYLMGNIGFLQSFTFLLFSFTIYYSLQNFKAKFLGLFLLIFSISFLWEVYVKSDLMSNFIIILSFISLWYFKYNNINLKKTALLAVLSSFLLFTRLVSIIPLTLLIFKAFIRSNLNKKVIYIISSILTLSILTFIVLQNCPSINIFKNNNPITLQNRQLPLFISFFIVVIPFYFSMKIKSLEDLIRYSLIFLFIPVIISFLISIFNNGFFNIIHHSAFDISYFNIVMPFLIYYIAIKYNNYLDANLKVDGEML